MFNASLRNASAIGSEEGLRALVQAFETGTLPKAEWTHAAHVAMGSHYVFLLGEADALVTMRARVQAYNDAVGTVNSATSGYHETLTRFWIAVLARLLQEHPMTSELECVQHAVTLYGGRRDLHGAYYNVDVVKSTDARREWVAPEHWPLHGIL